MDNNHNYYQDEVIIDFGFYFKLLKHNIRKILIVSLLFAIVGLMYSIFFTTKQYETVASVYVTRNDLDLNNPDINVVAINSRLANNSAKALSGDQVLSVVSKDLQLDEDDDLKEMVEVEVSSDTEIINITVTSKDSSLSKNIIKDMVKVFKKNYKDTFNIDKVEMISSPSTSKTPVSISKKVYILASFIIGLIGTCGYYFVKSVFTNNITDVNDINRILDIPAIGKIPFKKDIL